MKNIWTVMCAKAVIDQRSNSLSLHDVIEELTISFNNPEDMKKEEKQIAISFDIVSLWYDEDIKEERKVIYSIEIIDPQGVKMSDFPIEAIFEKNKNRLRSIAHVNGLKMSSEGKYLLKIILKEGNKNIEISETPLSVKFLLNIK